MNSLDNTRLTLNKTLIFFEALFKIKALWLCQFRFCLKGHQNFLVYLTSFRQMLFIFKYDAQGGIFSLSHLLWRICFVLLALRGNLFIVHHSKTYLISLLVISYKYFISICK